MILGVVLFFDGALLALGNVRPFLCCMGIIFFRKLMFLVF